MMEKLPYIGLYRESKRDGAFTTFSLIPLLLENISNIIAIIFKLATTTALSKLLESPCLLANFRQFIAHLHSKPKP
jgi:hypothetical protein